MKQMIKLQIVLTTALLLLMSYPSIAGPGGGEFGERGMRWKHLSRHLDLTEEQKNSVRSIMTEAKGTVVGDRREIRTLKKELANNLEPFDPVSAQLTADRIGAITTRIAFNASQAMSRVYALLSTEQREKFRAMREKVERRRAKRWHRRHGEDYDRDGDGDNN